VVNRVNIVAREAAAAVKKDAPPVQIKQGGGVSGRITLQERLAASIAKSRTGSPKIVTTSEDVAVTTVQSSGEPQQMESNGSIKESGSNPSLPTDTHEVPTSSTRIEAPTSEVNDVPSRTETPDLPIVPADNSTVPNPLYQSENSTSIDLSVVPPVSSEPILDPSSTRTSSVRLSTSLPPDIDPAIAELISQLRADLVACESVRLEESEQASSRITSLETKLRILAKTTLDTSKEVAENPTASPLERKLAEREEKIALLLDEGISSHPGPLLQTMLADSKGEKLAKIELNLMTTIKSLRVKQKEDAATTNAALSRAEKADKQLLDMKAQLRRANEIEKKNTERLKGMYKIEAANEVLRREREAAQVFCSGKHFDIGYDCNVTERTCGRGSASR
jgi:TATA element modulatory factor